MIQEWRRKRTDLKEKTDGKVVNRGQLNYHYGRMIELKVACAGHDMEDRHSGARMTRAPRGGKTGNGNGRALRWQAEEELTPNHQSYAGEWCVPGQEIEHFGVIPRGTPNVLNFLG